MNENVNELSYDAAKLAFYILFQAIKDAFDIETIRPASGGSRSKTTQENQLRNQRIEVKNFIMSDDLDHLCAIAKTHYEIPSPEKIREHYIRYKASGKKLVLRELIKTYSRFSEYEGEPSPSAQEKESKDSKE